MQKIIFVTGKGGVGKSTYAAALAHKYASQGQKTLLVELGDQSFYQEFFSLSRVNYLPVKLAEKLELVLWSGADCLKEYALYLLKSAVLYKLFFENKVSRALIQIAPALPELAILGKITSGPRKHGPPTDHDVIVIDGYSTGHFLALLKAPKGMAEVIQFGPMGEQSRSIFRTIMNPEICEYHIVTLAEELPYVESMELYKELENIVKIKPKLIFNRVIESSLAAKDIESTRNDFQRYLYSILENQENYLSQAKQKGFGYQKLPLLNRLNSLDFIQQLSQGINT